MDPGAPDRSPRFDDDLVGLDPEDPEARAFAAHLDRMQRVPSCTVEGYIRDVGEFAAASKRAHGGRGLAGKAFVALLLLIALWVIGNALVFVLTTWL